MIEPILRRMVDYEHRGAAVIILTLLTVFVMLWPAVDEYRAAIESRDQAKAMLTQAKEEVKQLPDLKQHYARTTQSLQQLEVQAVNEQAAQSLRNEIVQMVRQSDCMIRNIRLVEPNSRTWMENDDPIRRPRRHDRGAETPFQLTNRRLSISLVGPMTGIHRFLSKIHGIKKLIHTKHLSMKRSEGEEDQTVLELDLVLFDLKRKLEANDS